MQPVQLVFSWAPKLAKSVSKHWFSCGADGRRAGGVRSRDYQIFWDGSSAMKLFFYTALFLQFFQNPFFIKDWLVSKCKSNLSFNLIPVTLILLILNLHKGNQMYDYKLLFYYAFFSPITKTDIPTSECSSAYLYTNFEHFMLT